MAKLKISTYKRGSFHGGMTTNSNHITCKDFFSVKTPNMHMYMVSCISPSLSNGLNQINNVTTFVLEQTYTVYPEIIQQL